MSRGPGRWIAAALAAGCVAALAAAEAGAGGPDEELRDFDQDEEEHSAFWERALEPERERYEDLLERAAALLVEKDEASREQAGAILRDAVRLAPDKPTAHFLLGRFEAERGDFAGCVRSMARALELEPEHRPVAIGHPAEWTAEYELAVCRARGGDYEGGVAGLRRILERGHTGFLTRVVHQRLAECYMALGRLEEAKEALEQARRHAPSDLEVAFTQAVAHDRDEESAQAREVLQRALDRDPSANTLRSSQRLWLPAEDEHYYLGLVARQKGEPPRALYHFRRSRAAAPRSPWTARAAHHLEEAQAQAIAGRDASLKGSASLDLARAGAAIGKVDGELQACLRGTPDLLLQVTVTRVVAPDKVDATSATARPGVRVLVLEQVGVPSEELRAAIGCVEAAAGRIALPRPTGAPGTYATVSFSAASRGQAPRPEQK